LGHPSHFNQLSGEKELTNDGARCNRSNFSKAMREVQDRFHMVGDLLQRSGFLNVSGEKDNDGTGAYDRDGEPDDAPKWPAKTIFFPH
jgi:hypothetical protein